MRKIQNFVEHVILSQSTTLSTLRTPLLHNFTGFQFPNGSNVKLLACITTQSLVLSSRIFLNCYRFTKLPRFLGFSSDTRRLHSAQTTGNRIRFKSQEFELSLSISHLIYPLTARVVVAPQIISQPVSSIFPCSPLPSGTWRTPGL